VAGWVAWGCSLGDCTYETRFVGTTGSAAAPGWGTVTAEYLNLREYSDDSGIPSGLTWHIAAPNAPLEVQALTLRDATNPTEIVVSLPINHAANALSAGELVIVTQGERARLRELLSSGHAILRVEAGNAEPLTLPLEVTGVEQWHHPNCS